MNIEGNQFQQQKPYPNTTEGRERLFKLLPNVSKVINHKTNTIPNLVGLGQYWLPVILQSKDIDLIDRFTEETSWSVFPGVTFSNEEKVPRITTKDKIIQEITNRGVHYGYLEQFFDPKEVEDAINEFQSPAGASIYSQILCFMSTSGYLEWNTKESREIHYFSVMNCKGGPKKFLLPFAKVKVGIYSYDKRIFNSVLKFELTSIEDVSDKEDESDELE